MLKILDCSFRDGGYRTNWHFSKQRLESAVNLLDFYQVQACEIGFAIPNRGFDSGPFASVKGSMIQGLKDKSTTSLGFMAETKRHSHFESPQAYAEWLGSEGRLDFDFVRIATNINELGETKQIAEFFASKGLQVFVNIMKISELEVEQIHKAVDSGLNPQNSYVFADSFGNMTPQKTRFLFDSLSSYSSELELGFHGHNNRGFALANSLEALAGGAYWLDGTLAGHGRGSGNTKTEELLLASESHRELLISSPWLMGNHLENYEYDDGDYSREDSFAFHFGSERGFHPNDVMEMVGVSSTLDLGDVLERMSAGPKETDENSVSAWNEKSKTSNKEKFTDITGKKVLLLGRSSNREKILAGLRVSRPAWMEHLFLMNEPSETFEASTTVFVSRNYMVSGAVAKLKNEAKICSPSRLLDQIDQAKKYRKVPIQENQVMVQDTEVDGPGVLEYAVKTLISHFPETIVIGSVGHDSKPEEIKQLQKEFEYLQSFAEKFGVKITTLDSEDISLPLEHGIW